MKKTILAVMAMLLFISFNVDAASKITVDPTINSQVLLECDDPIAREDDTILLPGEIADRVFFVKQAGSWIEIGNNTTQCRQVITVTDIVDGVYLYTATVIDTDGRESLFAKAPDLPDGAFELTVKRLPPTKPPSNSRVSLLP